MAAKRQRFTPEFKREAVGLLERGDKTSAEIALELGVRRNLLYTWQSQMKSHGETGFRSPGRPPTSEDSEVTRLKRELARVTEERDILKKAAAYFAKELG